MSKKDAVSLIERETSAILNNILWNVGALVGSAILVDDRVRACLMNVEELEKDHRCRIDGKTMRVSQLFHHELKQEERPARKDELYAAAKRMLVADAFEAALIAADRYVAVLAGRPDPVTSERGSQPSMDLLSPGRDAENRGLLQREDAEFFRDAVAETRHAVTHSNGIVAHPEKRRRFGFDKVVRGRAIRVCLREDGGVSLTLGMSFDIFDVIFEVAACMGTEATKLANG